MSKKSIVLVLALFISAAAAVSWLQFNGHKHRPRYIFINQTENHSHDLALKMSLKLAESRSGIENSLILLKKLPEGKSIEETADDYFRKFGIGRNRGGKGLLFLYSEQENLFKIETSYALEGVFPDILCRQLEEAAKSYMLSSVPQDFLSELLITMNIRGKNNKAELEKDFSAPDWFKDQYLSGGAGTSARGYSRTLKDIAEAIHRLPEKALSEFAPSKNADDVVERYLKSLSLGLGDPRLPLLTEGSRVFRMIVPRNDAQTKRIFSDFQRALPYQTFLHEDLGLVLFHAGVENLPIVLRRSSDGMWFVDEPKSWYYFHRFENASDFYPKYDNLPFQQDLAAAHHPNAQKPLYANRVSAPRPGKYPYPLVQLVAAIESAIPSSGARAYAELGDVYLFEMGWLTKALECFEKARDLDPKNLGYHWRLYDLYMNNSEAEKSLSELSYICEANPADEQANEWRKFYRKAYSFEPGDF